MKKFFLLLLILFSQIISAKIVTAKYGMVVTEQHLASQVGIDILKAGGNAIDAAVAVGYALAVVQPCCGNIGGGGFMTLHLANGKNIFVNFRERAPLAIKPALFFDEHGNIIPKKSTEGYLAVAVPGTVLGLDTVLKKYGTMTRQQVMAPAIVLAKKGFVLTTSDARLLAKYKNDFAAQSNIAAIFLKNHHSYQAGNRFVQKDLAHILELIAKQGPKVFYQGSIAEAIVQASAAHHGVLSLKDFSAYTIQEHSPIYCQYEGYQIISAPPPSSGGVTLCEILKILEPYSLKELGFHSERSTHYIVEAMRYGFFDRNRFLGDPNYVHNPVNKLISKEYADMVRRQIVDMEATPSIKLNEPINKQDDINTTHYSILDKWGNAAAVTYTLNGLFGAKVIAGNTGFFLNNEIDDFTIKPHEKNQFGLVQGKQNLIQAGKRPLSSMTPTIIMRNNKVIMVTGSPGGPRIITATLLVILNVLDYKMNVQDAVNATRFHHQWLPDVIEMEPDTFSQSVINKLIKMGYTTKSQSPWSAVETIYVDPVTRIMYGANDKRATSGRALGF